MAPLHTKQAFGWMNALMYGPMIWDIAKGIGLLPKSLTGEAEPPPARPVQEPPVRPQPRRPVTLGAARGYGGPPAGGGLLPSLPTYGVQGMPKRAEVDEFGIPVGPGIPVSTPSRADGWYPSYPGEQPPASKEVPLGDSAAGMDPRKQEIYRKWLNPPVGNGLDKPRTRDQVNALGNMLRGPNYGPTARGPGPFNQPTYSPALQAEIERIRAERAGAPWPAGQYLTDPALQEEFARKGGYGSWADFEAQQRAMAGLPPVADAIETGQKDQAKLTADLADIKARTPWNVGTNVVLPWLGDANTEQQALFERLNRLRQAGISPEQATGSDLNEAARATTGEWRWNPDERFRLPGEGPNPGLFGQMSRSPELLRQAVAESSALSGDAAEPNAKARIRGESGAAPAQAAPATAPGAGLGQTGAPKWDPSLPVAEQMNHVRQITGRNHQQLIQNILMQRAARGMAFEEGETPNDRVAYVRRALLQSGAPMSARASKRFLERIAPDLWGRPAPTGLNEQEQQLREALLGSMQGSAVKVQSPVGGGQVQMFLSPEQQKQRAVGNAYIQGQVPAMPGPMGMPGIDLGPVQEQAARQSTYGSAYYGLPARPTPPPAPAPAAPAAPARPEPIPETPWTTPQPPSQVASAAKPAARPAPALGHPSARPAQRGVSMGQPAMQPGNPIAPEWSSLGTAAPAAPRRDQQWDRSWWRFGDGGFGDKGNP